MSLVERAKNIVLRPKDEWKVIDTEAATKDSRRGSHRRDRQRREQQETVAGAR